MRLLITDPTTVVALHDDVVSVRAEDESGSFGILDNHADFLTTLALSVITWRHADGRVRFCAVRRGVLTVGGRTEVLVATREATVSDDLDELERGVLARYRAESDDERSANAESTKLRMSAIRLIVQALKGGYSAGPGIGV